MRNRTRVFCYTTTIQTHGLLWRGAETQTSFLMLVAHSHTIDKDVWIKTGTKKKPKFIPVNSVEQAWGF